MRRTPILIPTLLVIATLMVTPNVNAASISTDATFGCDGRAVARYEDDPIGDFGNLYRTGSGEAHDLAVQDDGRIVVVGEGEDATSNGSIGVARFNTDGTPDDTFGAGGQLSTDVGSRAWGWAVALQADGAIVVAGNSFSDYPESVILARYDTSGALDPSFGTGGISILATGELDDVRDMTLLPDGSILVLASRFLGGDDRIVLLHFNDIGELDSSFGTSGIVVWGVPNVYGSDASRFALDSSGRIIVAGWADTDYRALIVAFDQTGVPDPTFGTDGYVMDALGPAATSFANDVYVSSGDDIWIGGSVVPTGQSASVAVGHYDASGSPESSFGIAGVATGNAGWGRALVLDDQGRPVIVGEGQAVPSAMADRFTAVGMLDSTFVVGGAPLEIGDDRPEIAAATQLSDGRILVAGGVGRQGSAGFALMSLTQDISVPASTCPDLSAGRFGGSVVGAGIVTSTEGVQVVSTRVRPGGRRRFVYTITNGGLAGDYFTASMDPNGVLSYLTPRHGFDLRAHDPDGNDVTNWLYGGEFLVYLAPGDSWTLEVQVRTANTLPSGHVQRLTFHVRSFSAGSIDRVTTRTVIK